MTRRAAVYGLGRRTVGVGALLGCLVVTTADCRHADRSAARAKEGAASSGYVLFTPLLSAMTYLIDRRGRVVHTWESDCPPGVSAYLLENGHLLRAGRQPDGHGFAGAGEGGRIQEFDWNGGLVWQFVLASRNRRQHHDVEPLPNGNVLLLAWEARSREQAIRAGRRPELVGDAGLWPESVLEVKPARPNGGEVVWEWHLWDHLVQDHDRALVNYGAIRDHPELIDVNGGRAPASVTEELMERLRALGYLAGGAAASEVAPDFCHANSVAYEPHLDQIALSVNQYNEVWIIDHSTTTAEAAGHTGGHAGRGGDLLYRWGNPRAYGRGSRAQQLLFAQHDARWVPPGFPGAGHLTIFNNGDGRPGGNSASVLEVDPPIGVGGRYTIGGDGRFGPVRPTWEYGAAPGTAFRADFLSGAQRLANGNTLVCAGPQGRIFEVTPNGTTVWEYENPFSGDEPNPHGDPRYSLFWATQIDAEHPGLAGRSLAPLDPQPPHNR